MWVNAERDKTLHPTHGLPHGGGREDGFPAKEQEHEGRAGFHESIHDRCGESSRCHGGCKRDKYVHFVVQLRVNTEGSECLCGALTKSNVS